MLVGTTARRIALGSVLVLAALLTGASAHAAPLPRTAGDTVTFGLGPSTATTVDGRPYYYYAAAPGAVLTDHVAVLNYSTKPLPLSLYATDGYNTFAGSSDLLAASKTPTDIGSWVHLESPRLMQVPGRKNGTSPPGKLIIPFSLRVPKDAAVGDHVGGLVLALRTKGRNAQGYLVDLDQRVGVQMFLRVAGALHPALVVENLKAKYHDSWNPFGTGSVTLSYTVRNVGNVRLGGRQRASVSAFFGSWPAHGLTDIPMLVPGGSAHVTTTFHGVWPEFVDWGHARVTALALASDVNPSVRPVAASTHFWAIPWAFLALLVALRLAYVLLKRLRRSHSGGSGPKHARRGGPAPEGPGDLPALEPVLTAPEPTLEEYRP